LDPDAFPDPDPGWHRNWPKSQASQSALIQLQRFGRYGIWISAHIRLGARSGSHNYQRVGNRNWPQVNNKRFDRQRATTQSVQFSSKRFDWQRFGRCHALGSSAHSTWGPIRFPQMTRNLEPEVAPSNQSAINWQRVGRHNSKKQVILIGNIRSVPCYGVQHSF
jgi:hypothetical protein